MQWRKARGRNRLRSRSRWDRSPSPPLSTESLETWVSYIEHHLGLAYVEGRLTAAELERDLDLLHHQPEFVKAHWLDVTRAVMTNRPLFPAGATEIVEK